MRAIRIRRKIDSQVLDVPELAEMMGKDVDIIVLDQSGADNGHPDLTALDAIAGKDVLDDAAVRELQADQHDMILVDTSVLIDYLRVPTARVRELLIEKDAAICGVTRAEMLCGARTDADVEKISAALAGFRSLDIPEPAWELLGRNLLRLRGAGITVPFQDALLATVAILYGIEVWTSDAHFKMMHAVLSDLRLFAEPQLGQ